MSAPRVSDAILKQIARDGKVGGNKLIRLVRGGMTIVDAVIQCREDAMERAIERDDAKRVSGRG